MLINKSFLDEGFGFSIQYKGKPITFPLQNLRKEIMRDPQWVLLNALEQVYLQGFLQQTADGYLLRCEDFYELDAELTASLPIPQSPAFLCLEENGNIGGNSYSISWYLLVHGKHAGKSRQKGCVASAGEYDFLLSREQYRLINELKVWKDDRNIESRARFQAKCKYLAQKAGVGLSNFTLNREFYFVDNAQIDLLSQDDRHLKMVPTIDEIPSEYQAALPSELLDITQARHGETRVNIFASKKAQQQYNAITQLPDIKGTDIPRFISNPLAFLPESIEFDADLFSERVRGLKIKTARAIPYIRQKNDTEDKWFGNIEFGHSISSESEDGHQIEDSPELRALMDQAAANGEEYIYYQDTWIKLDPEVYKQLKKADEEIKQALRNGADAAKIIPQILDIYDNIDGVQYDEKLQQLVAERYTVETTAARSFNGELKDYQLLGYQFLKNHYDSKTGILLADDMGLGKTVQIISLLAYMLDKSALAPSLLVMPVALIGNWQKELQQFLPAANRIYVHQGARRYRTVNMIRDNQIVITTYETLARDQALLGRIRWSCVICDEAQKVKNFNTLAASAIKGMNTPCRIALTGTPVENRLAELWSIVDFVQPGLLGSYKAFRQTYELPIEKHTANYEQLTEKLVKKIEPVFLRRTKDDVLDNLPPKQESSIPLAICKPQDTLYRKMIQEMRNSAENMALATIQKLMMVCSHPRLVTKQAIQGAAASELISESPKLAWAVQLLRNIKRKNEKVLIFTKYIAMQAILRQVIYEEFRVNAPIINGEISGDRTKIIEAFEAQPGFSVMILSPRAAGVGLNITAANHVIHYTREWNPAVENQATDRAYRIGQDKPVSVYYPVMKAEEYTSVEERLDELLTSKRQLMKSVILPTDLEIKAEQFFDILN